MKAQEWLNKNISQEKRVRATSLRICQEVEGELDLSDFVDLDYLEICDNKLTYLNLSGCQNLSRLDCSENSFTNLDFLASLPNKEKLTILFVNDCKIRDLTPLSEFTNLEFLKVNNNSSLTGSLKSLRNLTKLYHLDITYTDLETNLEELANFPLRDLRLNQKSIKKIRQDNRHLLAKLASFKKDKNDLTNKLKDHDTTLTNVHQQIDQLQAELTEKKRSSEELKQISYWTERSSEFEGQVMALALSSGLLSQQCEDLSGQLAISEQESERKGLELEIKDSLLREKDDSLNEQAQQIQNYQALLRRSEESLSKGQEIVSRRGEELEKLEEERDSLIELLEQSKARIDEVEDDLINNQAGIRDLESQIKDLEQNNPQASELVSLKKELTNLRNSSQRKIDSLKNELGKAKLREEVLSKKIKDLTTKKAKVVEEVADSWWDKIKGPCFYGVGVIIVLGVIGWVRSKVKL